MPGQQARAGAEVSLRSMEPMRVIETGSFVLEPQVAGHAEEMFVVLSDPAIYEYENEPPGSVEELRERFARLESRLSPDGQQQWLNWVIRMPSGELIGYVQATVFPDGRAALAYMLHSAYWGRGLASEVVRAMIGELAEQHGAQRLIAVLKLRNQRSLRLLERLGFAPVAHEPQEHDEIVMEREV